MTENSLPTLVTNWAKARGLDKVKPQAQATKVAEEIGELNEALIDYIELKGDTDDVRKAFSDAIGDIQVTIIILSMLADIDYHKAHEDAERALEQNDNISAYMSSVRLTVALGQVMEGINKDWHEELATAISNIDLFTMTISQYTDVDYHEALEKAYNVIAKRKGKPNASGLFVKEEDLHN